jgi:methyl-accepting chemotaxis protein
MEQSISAKFAQLTILPQYIKKNIGCLHRLFKSKMIEAAPLLKEAQEDITIESIKDVGDEDSVTNILQSFDSTAIIKTMTKSTAALSTVCGAAESDFLDLGAKLQEIYVESEELTQTVITILSTDQDQTIHSALKSVQSNAAIALKELHHRRNKLIEDLDGLKTIQIKLKALSQQNNSFKLIAKNLKMVALNISIESARTREAEVAFEVIAYEINQLAQNVHVVAGDVSDNTRRVQQNLDTTQTAIGMRMQHLDELINSAEITVKDALEKVENLTQITMQMLDTIGSKSKEISVQVGQLVMGIQIHDSISQRVEHINSAFHEALELIETSTTTDVSVSEQKSVLGRLYGTNRLQVAQLKTIITDVSVVRDQSITAFDKLLNTIKAITQLEGMNLSPFSTDKKSTIQNSSVINNLHRALEQLILLFDEGVEDIQRLTAARKEIGQTIAQIGQHIDKVRNINFDIHLKSLNAVIKSMRLGSTGKAIEAVVNEMKALAEQSNTTIQDVTGIMEQVALASKTVDQSKQNEISGNELIGGQLRNNLEDFSRACLSFQDQSQETLKKGGQIQKKISNARQHISFFDQLIDGFNQHHTKLKEVYEYLVPFADAIPEKWMEEEKKIIERYTMQRERDAHSQMIKNNDKLNSLQKEDQNQNERNDDNIELF